MKKQYLIPLTREAELLFDINFLFSGPFDGTIEDTYDEPFEG